MCESRVLDQRTASRENQGHSYGGPTSTGVNCHGTVNSYITYYYETLRDATDYRVHAKKMEGIPSPIMC
jgi:hypothetical protein